MIEFRKATVEDIDELIRLRIDFLKEAHANEVPDVPEVLLDEALEEHLQSYFQETIPDDRFIAWLAVDAGKIVATSGVCFYNLAPSLKNISGKVAYILNMYTLPEYRGQHIAKQLFETVIAEAGNRGYRMLSLHATEMGRSVYHKFGFKERNSEMVYRIG